MGTSLEQRAGFDQFDSLVQSRAGNSGDTGAAGYRSMAHPTDGVAYEATATEEYELIIWPA